MKVSLNIINKLINIADLSPEEIAEKLTYAGVKVEGIDELAIGKGLTTGLVKHVESMPDSDHLHLVKVDCGQYGLLDIVCGAPNVRDGLKVIVALDGALLRDGKIKRGTIRGHLSEGMICSLAELGLDKKFLKEEDAAGIMELPADTPIGIEDVLSYLHLRHTILDLELLADRSDLYSLINVAKEIGIDTSGKIWIQAGQAWIFHQCFHYHLAEYPFKCRSLIFIVAVTKHLIPFCKPYKVNDFMKGHSQCALFTVEEKHLKPLLF